MRVSRLDRGGVLKKWLKRVGVGLLVLIGVLLMVVLAAWQYLTSDAGAARVRSLALDAAGEALAGRLEVKNLSLKGGVIVLEDVKLYTPEGELVGELKRAEVRAELLPLLEKNVVIEQARIDGLRLYLASDERGLNLSRAVAAKVPTPDDPNAPPTSFHVDVRALVLEGGHVDWQKEYVVDAITIAGAADVRGSPLKLNGKLDVKGSLLGPREGVEPLPLTLAASGTQQKLDLQVQLGEARLNGAFSLDDTAATIDELFVPPQVAERFAGELPLKVPLVARGKASPTNVDLSLEAGSARATVKATLAGAKVPAFSLSAENVDLAELLGQGRPSQLQLHAKGSLTDTTPATLTGSVEVDAEWARVGTLGLSATASAGTFDIKKAVLDARGGSVRLRGRGTMKSLALEGNLEATDLAALAKVIGEVTGGPPPPLGGKGKAYVSLVGPTLHPRLTANGELVTLQAGGVAAQGLSFSAELADATRPFEAKLDASVAKLTVAERTFSDVRAHLDTRGRDLDLLVSTKGLTDLTLMAKGTVDADGQGVQLAELQLTYPEAQWLLEAPTHVSIADGVKVESLALVAVDQRLALQLESGGGRIDATADLRSFDLAKLPPALVPASLGLRGRIDAHATATGRAASPDAEATVTLRDGAVKTLKSVNLTARAKYTKDRASGTVDVKSSLATAKATFDVPVKGLQKQSNEPLSAIVTVDGVVLEELGALLETEVPAKGRASLKLEAEGTAAKPRISLHAEAVDAVWVLEGERYVPVDRLTLDVTPDSNGALAVALNARAFEAEVAARLTTPLTAEAVRAAPPTAEGVKTMPVRLELDVQHLQLEALEGARLLQPGYQGAVSVKLTAKGSLLSPDAEGTVTLEKVASARFKPIDATVAFEANREATTVKVNAKTQKTRLADLVMTAWAPLETVTDLERVTVVRMSGEGRLGPFTLADLMNPNPDETQPRGTVAGDLELQGTLKDPKAVLRANLQDVAFGKVALGKANVRFDYENATSNLQMTLFTGAGRLRAKGALRLDLSQPALMKGVGWKEAPVELEVKSDQLDLAFLSGALETIPRVEGKLDMNAKVQGTLGLPQFIGDVALKQGRVAVAGFGEYREIELIAGGSDEAVTLEKLFAKAGGGWVGLHGAARKRGDSWVLEAGGESKSFPIVTDDQLKASATIEDLKVDGLFTADLIDIREVRIPRAVIELPEVKGKDLQGLERPESIVLVRNGVPLTKKGKMKLASARGQPEPEVKAPARRVRIVVQADKNIWVKGSDVNVELGLSPDFKVEVDETAMLSGEVKVKRGRLDVIGRRFDLDPSSFVRFQGLATRAIVNVTAVHENQKEGVTVFATVTGQLPQFNIRLSSNPSLSDSDIFALLATGRRTLKQSSGGSSAITNDQVASVLGSLMASQLKGVLGKKLPLDVLSIETGSDGLKGSRVEGGKYLTDDIYLGVEARVGADTRKGENNVAARIEYEFVPHWTAEAYGGDAAYGADLVWSREF
ncbi:MAG: translocation/assembly module TamB domain-containing protein [Myxococcaceae bacterium]|nr:translocation/assembly module TamB domain-containing protein [Myxococcaceae bacterium]